MSFGETSFDETSFDETSFDETPFVATFGDISKLFFFWYKMY
jgi:hypothetical protein